MKSKLLYVVSGLLTLSIVAAMFFGPSLYFSYEDWSKQAETQTEPAGLEQRSSNLDVADKLQLYAHHNSLISTNAWVTEETRMSRTFIPSGREIRQSYLPDILSRELETIAGYFDEKLLIHQVLMTLSKQKFSLDNTTSAMLELVSLSESTKGFVFWSVDFFSGPWTCQFSMDAETGMLYYLNVNYFPDFTGEYESEISYSGQPEDNDQLIRDLYQLSVGYLGLWLSAEDTRYAPAPHNDDTFFISYDLNCDAPELSMAISLSYTCSSSGYSFSLSPVYSYK